MSNLHNAEELAFHYHKDQKYGCFPYTYHLNCVALAVTDFYQGDIETLKKLNKIAWLHDILEDTDCTAKEIYDTFGLEIGNAVLSLSKLKYQDYDDYINEVRSNELASRVKIADTYCNLTQSLRDGNSKRIVKYSEQLKRLVE